MEANFDQMNSGCRAGERINSINDKQTKNKQIHVRRKKKKKEISECGVVLVVYFIYL